MSTSSIILPGALATAVVKGTEVRTDLALPVPWWSFAKTVLAGAALVLVAEGCLPLDEPLPGKLFTLRQLLGHRAGLRCYGTLPAYHAAVAAGEHPWPAEDMLRRVNVDTLAYQPGQGWGYSNVGYLLVRNLIEAAANLPLGPALEHLVLRPLGIAGVTVAREPADLDATAWGNNTGYHPGWVYHGLLVGPAGAAALFLHRILAGQLLPPGLLAAMQQGHPVDGVTPGRPWTTAGYGLGLMIGRGQPPGEYVGHTGEGPGSTSAVYSRIRTASGGTGRCTAAAFAPANDVGVLEAHAMQLATEGI